MKFITNHEAQTVDIFFLHWNQTLKLIIILRKSWIDKVTPTTFSWLEKKYLIFIPQSNTYTPT